MDVSPLSTPDQPSNDSQLPEITQEQKEEMSSGDTEIIINTVSKNCKPEEYIRMDVPPLPIIPDHPSDKCQSSEIIQEQQDNVSNDDT